MRKIYQGERWKRYSRRRARKELKKRRRGKLRAAALARKKHGVPRSPARRRIQRVDVAAPKVFSLIRNPEESTAFFARLAQVFQTKRDAYVVLADVEELTSDAVVVLLSKLIDDRFLNGMTFGGNEPKAEGPKKLLHQAGFFEFVRSNQLKEPPEDGRIRRKTSTIVESAEAARLIQFATMRTIGRAEDRRSAYLALVECMANTHEHSEQQDEGVNPWWANVYCPSKSRSSYFTVVDNGVGIFRSVTVRRVRRVMQKLVGDSGNADLLRDWLEGRIELPSRTGLRNRGKGLRAIHDRFKQGKLANLIVISNDVYANLRDNNYQTLAVPFKGTMIYWELSE